MNDGGETMIINGEKKEIPHQIALLELLWQEGFQKERIAVELNGEILPKSQYDSAVIQEKDRLEIVSFVGGG